MLGNLGEMAKMFSRIKEIQRGMKEYRDEMPRLEFSANSADGSVTATVSGDMVVKRIDFASTPAKKAAIIEAVNSANVLAKKALRDKMKELSGGMDLPDLM